MAKPLKVSAKTIRKATDASLTDEGQLALGEGEPEELNDDDANEDTADEEPGDSDAPEVDDAANAPAAPETAPGSTQTAVRVPPVVMPTPKGETVVESGLGLVPGRRRPTPWPALPTNEPKGHILGLNDPLVVPGIRKGDNVVMTTDRVYRRVLPPNSNRWTHILLYPANTLVTGREVRLLSEVEAEAAEVGEA